MTSDRRIKRLRRWAENQEGMRTYEDWSRGRKKWPGYFAFHDIVRYHLLQELYFKEVEWLCDCGVALIDLISV